MNVIILSNHSVKLIADEIFPGHVYCIGECGGAMEEAKCPECNATIGGKNHALHQGNAVATEMDGARHAAWSEHANLNNYDIDLLG